MAVQNTVDSNKTGLRCAEEIPNCIGELTGSEVWEPLEPNSYGDFGPTVSTTPREPIAADRQRNRGVVTDLEAVAAFQLDLVASDVTEKWLSGFMFADWERKEEELVTGVTALTYEVADESGFAVDDLICGQNHALAANNGLKLVTSVAVGEVRASGLAVETPPTTAVIRRAGIQAGTADLNVDATTDPTRPRLTSTLLDFTAQGLSDGEWVYVGGDAAANQFVTEANNGFCRIAVNGISTNALIFDKTQGTMATETGTGLDIRLFFGDVLRNRNVPADIKKKSFQFERDFGTGVDFEYIVGAVANTLTLNMPTTDKVTADLSFAAIDGQELTAAKAGTRPALTSEAGFNTVSSFGRLRFSKLSDLSALETYLTELTLEVNNNVSPVKALCALGAVDVTAGFFQVSGSLTALFSSIAVAEAARANTDATLDFALVSQNEGFLFDVLRVVLGDARANIEINSPITIPVTLDASRDEDFNRTMLIMKFHCLPDRAENKC